MKLTVIIDEIKAKCPTFGGRVAGAAEYANLRKISNLDTPAAYVIPLDDNAGENQTRNSYKQDITEGFAVIVIVTNTADHRGQAARNAVHDLRAELWRALLGWDFDAEYECIEYSGGNLLHMDRSRLDFQFEFSAMFQIGVELTRLGADLDALPALETVRLELDGQNLDPDGTIDHTLDIPIPQD